MPFIVTPGQYSRRAELYHQMAQLTSAGVGVIGALEHLHRNPPSHAFRAPLRIMLDQIGHGASFCDALRSSGGWTPAFDVALLEAGEHSGRLDACFRLLADYYEHRARIGRQIIADLAYPVFLFHFAIFIIPFADFFKTGKLLPYLLQTFGVLIPIYAIVVLLIYAAQGKHGEAWRGWVERILNPVPVLGTARRYLALSRLAASLEALINAGVSIVEGWNLAAAASGSPALRRVVLGWKPQIQAGQTPAEALNASGRFPEMFANLYATGEVSGKLDEALRQLHNYYQVEGVRKLHAVTQWTPRIVFLLVALLIGYRVVSFYTDYFKQIDAASHF